MSVRDRPEVRHVNVSITPGLTVVIVVLALPSKIERRHGDRGVRRHRGGGVLFELAGAGVHAARIRRQRPASPIARRRSR